MPYINRENGQITGLFANKQFEDQEFLPDDSEEILNFGKPSSAQARITELKQYLNDTDYKELKYNREKRSGDITQSDYDLLITAYDTQRKAWVDEINALGG